MNMKIIYYSNLVLYNKAGGLSTAFCDLPAKIIYKNVRAGVSADR